MFIMGNPQFWEKTVHIGIGEVEREDRRLRSTTIGLPVAVELFIARVGNKGHDGKLCVYKNEWIGRSSNRKDESFLRRRMLEMRMCKRVEVDDYAEWDKME